MPEEQLDTKDHDAELRKLREIQSRNPARNLPAPVGPSVSQGMARFKAMAVSPEQQEAARLRQEQLQRQKIEAAKRGALKALERSLGPRYSQESVCLERFAVYHANQEPILRRFKALDFRQLASDGRNLILFGSVGTGKDRLLAYALYEAILGMELTDEQKSNPVLFFSGQEFYGELRDMIDSHASEKAFMDKLSAPKILAVSDPIPPSGNPTDYNTAQLHRLIDRRYRLARSTWMTMNANSIEEIDEKLTPPVFDRLREGAEIFACLWPSCRERADNVARSLRIA